MFQPSRAWIRHEPLGVVGVIAPWNYPLLLALGPTVENLIQYSSSGVAAFLQRAGIAALQQGESFVEHQIARAREGREIVSKGLAETGRVTFGAIDGAFYLFFKVEGIEDTRKLAMQLVDEANEFNPLAPRSTRYVDPTLTGAALNANTNVLGVWSFKYRTDRHNNRSKSIFYQWNATGTRGDPKRVPARFGSPWAGRSYGLVLPARSGVAGMQDGYAILSHMANQPFTQEFVSVKLCRLLVHDGFQTGYDFTDGATSPEEELVHACMLAWENGSPQGQIREVLRVILNSELFRRNDGSLQKVKTPLERLFAEWKKASQEERAEFLKSIKA
jgi:hypothetical protein